MEKVKKFKFDLVELSRAQIGHILKNFKYKLNRNNIIVEEDAESQSYLEELKAQRQKVIELFTKYNF